MKQHGINHELFIQNIVTRNFRTLPDGLAICSQCCPDKFDELLIKKNIIEATFNEDYFNQLKQLNKEKKLGLSHEQLDVVRTVEKELSTRLLQFAYAEKK